MTIGPTFLFPNWSRCRPIGLVRNAGPVDTYALCYAVAPAVSHRTRVMVECFGDPAALLYRKADIFTGKRLVACGLVSLFKRLKQQSLT